MTAAPLKVAEVARAAHAVPALPSGRPMEPPSAQPVVRLLPAAEADATEIAYYRDRLEDPTLLDVAAAVLVNGLGHLAVPVGSRRRGGYLPVQDVVTGLAVRALLVGRPGFPDVRLRWSADLDVCHNVEWGERPPEWGDSERGRFYGYRAGGGAR